MWSSKTNLVVPVLHIITKSYFVNTPVQRLRMKTDPRKMTNKKYTKA